MLGSLARHVKWFTDPSQHPTDYSLLLSRKLEHAKNTEVFLAFNRSDERSSIAVFTYDRNVSSLGLSHHF